MGRRPKATSALLHSLAATREQKRSMDRTQHVDLKTAGSGFSPFEAVPGALDAGALIICDHASNAFPPGYGALGLPRETLERHIAYDIGAAWLTRLSRPG